jgi:hypothetical protein
MLSPQHLALNREAGIAAELIASGVTLLGRASYARTGLYGQAFFNLSIGFERTTKLIYIADYAIDNAGEFPSNDMLKSTIGHDLDQLFSHVEAISTKRRNGKEFSERPHTDIHNGIVQTLTEFARNTRYYNLDLVTGGKAVRNSRDPMTAWNERVIQPIVQMIANIRVSVTPSTSCPDGTASPSNTARTRSGGGNRLRLIYCSASPLKIRSKASGETTHVRAAVGRNSKSAAMPQCGLDRSPRGWFCRSGKDFTDPAKRSHPDELSRRLSLLVMIVRSSTRLIPATDMMLTSFNRDFNGGLLNQKLASLVQSFTFRILEAERAWAGLDIGTPTTTRFMPLSSRTMRSQPLL